MLEYSKHIHTNIFTFLKKISQRNASNSHNSKAKIRKNKKIVASLSPVSQLSHKYSNYNGNA